MSKKPLSTSAMLESEDDFAEAYENYGQGIFRFLFWRTKDPELSEDLTSSVFEKAWRSRTSFRGGSAKAWLYRIARNTLTDHWRSKREIALDNLDEFEDEQESAADRLDLAIEVRALRIALQSLPKDMREVVECRFVLGLSARQTGAKLSLSEANVRVIQYRALRRIKKELS